MKNSNSSGIIYRTVALTDLSITSWYIFRFVYKYICLTSVTRAKLKEKWNFLLNFWTMRKLSECYSGIFQTQSSGCASGVDHFRNFTKLKILNI